MIVASTDSGNLVHCGNQKAHNPNDKTVIHSGSSAPIFYRHAPSDQKLIFEGRNFVINSRKIRMEHETVTVCPFKDSLIIVSSDSIDLWPSKLIGLLVSSSDASHRTDSETLALISRHRIHICTRKNTGTFSSVVGDYLVLAGEQKLGIFNLSMKTKHSMRLSTEGDAVISCVSGSFFKRSLVAVGWSNGTVQLVDVNALSVIHAFTKCHSAPVSELAFSPFNRYLLISGNTILY